MNTDSIENFWKRVDRTGECWEWTASIMATGYGDLWVEGQHWRAHRFAWIITYGSIPGGLFVCHHCDNRRCVRPDHLFLGTNRDNIRDAAAKNRNVVPPPFEPGNVYRFGSGNTSIYSGELNGHAKVTEDIVREIRRLHQQGMKIVELSRRYNLSIAQTSRIANYQRWKHLRDDGK